MPLTQAALVFVGLLLAAWTLAAGIVILAARGRLRRAEAAQRNSQRLARMIDEAPAVPLLVRSDDRIEAPQRLADWLGLEAVPAYLSELDQGTAGLELADLAKLSAAIRRTQRTAAPFRLVVTPRGGQRGLAMRGALADPQVSPGGAALVWVFEAADGAGLPAGADRQGEHDPVVPSALAMLIDGAPVPMWIRAPGGELRFVNTAYVEAVGAADAAEVLRDQIELVEPVDGVSAREFARRATVEHGMIERTIGATTKGQRRAFRVIDLPLGGLGTAGYAIDIEVFEEAAREIRALRDAQLEVLDDVSSGVARFDGQHQLTFANAPFQSIFALDRASIDAGTDFERVLDAARDARRLPELRDYPDWRRDKLQWFLAAEPREEAWPLPSGTHLRVVGLPQPDGGLVMIAEDRTEQLRLSAIRDTMLRTRTATFDGLFESLALFSPDGRMDVWNRRFANDWGLDTEFLDAHPHVSGFARRIAPKLKVPGEADAIVEAVRSATLDRREIGGRVHLADGRALAYAGVPLPDGNGMLTVLDMTDAHKAEEALRACDAKLQEAEKIKERFLAEFGQEFRHPLAVIAGFAERVRDGLGGELNELGREYVEAILESVQQIDENTGQLLAISRGACIAPTAGEDIELYALARQLVVDRRGRIEQAGLHLDLRGSPESGRVSGRRQQLARAIGTLLDNAIAATPPGGRILFEVSREKPGSDRPARIVISDSGSGADESTPEFTPAAATPQTGMQVALAHDTGVALARALIEACGGTLEFHSEPGMGSAAIVELR